ncbi:MAG: hypothetical protein J2P19_08700 [Pseudonocardia sp.]|nr:hypothetical protein [Pseudonocardia sp.]
MADRPLVAEGTRVEQATGELLSAGIGDGLPVVPPTEQRVARMLAAVPEPDTVLGQIPPLFGELTAAAVGYFAVLAGCLPAELPVVMAAVRACLEPEFNLLGVQTTTGTAAVAVVVHGPVVAELGFNSEANVLGPGNRVNACAGRAVALALAGIGGARPGVTDMATTGQPARYTCCLAERQDSPFPLLAGVDAVTVRAIGGIAEVLPRGAGGTVAELLDPVTDLLAGAALAAGDPTRMAMCEQSVVLPPEVAGRLVERGASAESVRHYLYERGNAVLAERAAAGAGARVAASPEHVRPIVSGGAGVKMLHLPGWIGCSRSVTRRL